MEFLPRKLRGAFGTAVTWAAGWAVVGFVPTAILFILSPSLDPSTFPDVAMLTILGGVSGLVGGTVFSTVLRTVHRRRHGQACPDR
jgi:Na+/proline symporter